MQSSNPVLTRLGEAARASRYETGYGPGYPGVQTPSRAMSMDDVVVRTVALLAVTGVVGAAAWVMLPASSVVTYFAAVMASLAGLVLGLVISFRRVTSPAVIIPYAALQGIALGVISRAFESWYSGIVIQAVIGTFGIFGIMAALYKLQVLRATPRFTKFVIGALIGVVVLSFANWLFYLFGLNLGLREYTANGHVSWLPIVFSIVVIAVGALTFILDFDAIEQGMRYGLPEKYAWYCAFGILVGLIFLYYEILRLLSYLRR
ncbi:Bax inhibitor-1/YccA family protein [Dactylosporangium sp. NPDC048998]|uniref:Bax inhibitor-1/YccA family protein n=1 Tax=Dactylosporangium sp. NPDC048998 TaxID=3363976 RepID=UPI0037211A62